MIGIGSLQKIEKIRKNMKVQNLSNKTKTENVAFMAHWYSVSLHLGGRVFKPRHIQCILT
jgi:hypothetical protein